MNLTQPQHYLSFKSDEHSNEEDQIKVIYGNVGLQVEPYI